MTAMRHILAALCFGLLTACGFVHDERIDGPYRLVAIDTSDQMMICFDLGKGNCIGRTPSTTIGYNFNERWVTAAVQRGPGAPTKYYFIDRSADDKFLNADEITQGPLSEAEFIDRAQELGLPAISRQIR
jgi:hypothetical protein